MEALVRDTHDVGLFEIVKLLSLMESESDSLSELNSVKRKNTLA